MALELIENFSRFVRSEIVVFLVFPHLQTQVDQQTNKTEVYYSINLFCKLVNRIRYVSKTLANGSAFSGYIKSFIDLCKNDPSLKNQIFRNIKGFIYLNMIFSIMNLCHKLEEKFGRNDQEFTISKVFVGLTRG